jgi:hypothetical protein
MKKHDQYQDHLEWELLEQNQEITYLTFERGLYKLRKDCIIEFFRDNQYDLVASISGILDHHNDIEIKGEQIAGTFIDDEIISGFSKDGIFRFRLFGVVIAGHTSSPISANSPAARFTAKLIFDKVERSYSGFDNETESVQEWYLSGKSEINFPRLTKRSVEKSYKKLREGIDPEEGQTIIRSHGSNRDHILISTADFDCIVAEVIHDYGPNWSYNLSIEYRKAFGKIPTEAEREAISELVSFVFGCQLLKIGQTSYDKTNSITLQEYKHPWGDNVVSKCERSGFPPVHISNYQDWGRVEILLNELVPHYLAQRSTLRLKDVLWKFWLSKDSSLGTNLPILSSAIETLAEQILKAHPDKKHYYIEQTKFVGMIKNELGAIEKTLGDNIFKERILNKLKGASQRGPNEKLEMMFEILELPIGKTELRAIKARNKMAHSSIGKFSLDEIRDSIRLSRAYETLFHRVFLKLLSYSGNYIDYYSLGHPQRPIDEPIPE